MQHQDNHMDDLFRRAAGEYPLDTSGADWSVVEAALQHPEEQRPLNRRHWLWVLLLLPFSWVCNHYITDASLVSQSEQSFDPPGYVKPLSASAYLRAQQSASNTPLTNTEHKQHGQSEKSTAFKTDQQKAIINSTPVQRIKLQQPPAVLASGRAGHQLHTNNPSLLTTSSSQTRIRKGKMGQLNRLDADQLPADDRGAADFQASSFTSLQKTGSLPQHDRIYTFAFPAAEEKLIVAADAKQLAVVKSDRVKRFYAGLAVGLDATTIKMQQVSKAGYDAGIITGYQIDRRWSVEAGLFRDKKYYYTRGSEFSTAKIYLPQGRVIRDVDGYCSMWEIPVGVRYIFSPASRNQWFGRIAGSSFIMTNEYYNYDVYNTATGSAYYYARDYSSTSRYFMALLQFSGGFSRKIGKAGSLRIEPYINLPLRGVGLGSLPLQGGGLHLGFTRNWF